MEETIRRKKSALKTMLGMMEVPEMRMDLDKASNLRWLNRNLAARNTEHPLFKTAQDMIIWLIKN